MPDCQEEEFFAVSETFGGTKPVPSCMPGEERPADEMHTLEGVTSEEALPPVLSIRVSNRLQTAYCESLAIEVAGQRVEPKGLPSMVGDGKYTYDVQLTADLDIDITLLQRIVVNDLIPKLEVQYHAGSVTTVDDVVGILGVTTPQATEILQRLNDKQEELDLIAADLAALGLICLWYNAEQEAECRKDADGKSAASHQEVEGAVNYAVVPAGTVTSEDSYAAANSKAKALAEASLNCLFASEAVSVSCCSPDRPGARGTGECEEVQDSNIGYGGRRPRVGRAYIETGKFTSVVSVADATARAREMAWAMLECYYVNDIVYKECGSDIARSRGELPSKTGRKGVVGTGSGTGQYVTIPYGSIVSETDTTAANAQAEDLALSMLECCFVNDAYTKSCDVVKYVTDDGDEIAVHSSSVNTANFPDGVETDGITSTTVPEGTFIVCMDEFGPMAGGSADPTSQSDNLAARDRANEMAKDLLSATLECTYCNVAIMPKCVPEWVVTAAKTGIPMEDGTIFRLELPIDLDTLKDPLTGKPVDKSTWSVDATFGVAAATFCGDNFYQSQDIADVGGTVRISQDDECRYQNDPIIAGCMVEDPYNGFGKNTPGKWNKKTKFENGDEPYLFFTSYQPPEKKEGETDEERFDTLNTGLGTQIQPAAGTYVEIPAGAFTFKSSQVPGTIPKKVVNEWGVEVDNPFYNEDYNRKRVKEYANEMAIASAEVMLDCYFVNRKAIAACDYPEEQPYFEFTGEVTDPSLASVDKWVFGRGLPTPAEKGEKNGGLAFWSNLKDSNPVVIEAEEIRSKVSVVDAYKQTLQRIMRLLECPFCNKPTTMSCRPVIPHCETPPPDMEIEGCTVFGDTQEEADALARAMSMQMESLCTCHADCFICNEDKWGSCLIVTEGDKNPGKPGKIVRLEDFLKDPERFNPENPDHEEAMVQISVGFVPAGSICTSKPECCANPEGMNCPDYTAQMIADAMTTCMPSAALYGRKGKDGRDGQDGKDGKCESGACNGVYA